MNSRCAACKYLRRRCPSDCIFSPYFPSNNPQRFASVHRIYGASNIGKMLQQIPQHLRAEAANSMYIEAQCRLADPVYGCVKTVSLLFQQIRDAESQLATIQAEIAFYSAQMRRDSQMQSAGLQPPPGFSNYLAEQGNSGGLLPHPTPLPCVQPPPWFI